MESAVDTRDYEKDWPGLPINYLILSCDDFIVFLDNENNVDWKTTDEFDAKKSTKDECSNHNNIMNGIAECESILHDDLDVVVAQKCERQLGEALVQSFRRDYTNAQSMLISAKKYIIDRNSQHSRFLLLKYSGITCLGFFVLGVILWLFRSFFIGCIGETVFYVSLSSIAGSIGAYFSIILRMGNVIIDYNATRKLHYWEAFSKIIAGVIAAILISLCVKCKIILNVYNDPSSLHIIMIIAGLVSGASERLAPSIINKLASIDKSKNNEKESINNN